jgi:hypothetical protein
LLSPRAIRVITSTSRVVNRSSTEAAERVGPVAER